MKMYIGLYRSMKISTSDSINAVIKILALIVHFSRYCIALVSISQIFYMVSSLECSLFMLGADNSKACIDDDSCEHDKVCLVTKDETKSCSKLADSLCGSPVIANFIICPVAKVTFCSALASNYSGAWAVLRNPEPNPKHAACNLTGKFDIFCTCSSVG